MMEIREFTEKMKNEVREFLPEDVRDDLIITDVEIVKMNDQKLHGLSFRMPGSEAAPTLYVDELYDAYREGADFHDLAFSMADMYGHSMNAAKPPEVDLSYDLFRDKMTVRLLEYKRNREFLSNMPYVSVGNGLVITADLNMGADRDGEWRVAVNNNVLESFGVDKEQLFADAMSSAELLEPATLVDMSNALFSSERDNLLDRKEPLAPEDVGGMYVLTNSSGSLGASALFYPDVKERAGELLGSDYYILPSSIHELILVPETMGISAKELSSMVKQANRSVVDEKDVLSDSVYHYSRNDRKLDKVDPDRGRGDRVAEAR